MARLSIHHIMSIVRNTVVLRNATLGALAVLALFECNEFVAVRFGIKGVFCKENRSNTLRTSRVHGPRPCTRHVHGHLHGPTRPVHGWCRRAVCTAHTRPCTGRVYGTAVIRPCTGRFRGQYTAAKTRVHGPCNGHTTRYTAVYTAVYTTRYTAVYTARTRPQNGRLHGRGRPVHGRVTAV